MMNYLRYMMFRTSVVVIMFFACLLAIALTSVVAVFKDVWYGDKENL